MAYKNDESHQTLQIFYDYNIVTHDVSTHFRTFIKSFFKDKTPNDDSEIYPVRQYRDTKSVRQDIQ